MVAKRDERPRRDLQLEDAQWSTCNPIVVSINPIIVQHKSSRFRRLTRPRVALSGQPSLHRCVICLRERRLKRHAVQVCPGHQPKLTTAVTSNLTETSLDRSSCSGGCLCAYCKLQYKYQFSIENHTCQGCFLDSFCISNRKLRRKMACILQFATRAHRLQPITPPPGSTAYGCIAARGNQGSEPLENPRGAPRSARRRSDGRASAGRCLFFVIKSTIFQ